jgi:hypothetical protein
MAQKPDSHMRGNDNVGSIFSFFCHPRESGDPEKIHCLIKLEHSG